MANMDPNAATTADHHHVPVRHGTFQLRGVYCLGCSGAVERALREQPHVTDVRLDWKSDVVHVGYDPARIGPEDIEHAISQTGCDCKATEVEEDHHHETMAPPERRIQHLGHGVDTQPISMGTKHDRMQYEMPATHADHGDHMGHDMSDPNMAKAMERDMRNKFFVALLLTIPTVLYSLLGVNLLGMRLPTFGLGENVIMLLLSTPVVFYSGWIFISGAYHSLRSRTLNMSVLIATGVLAAYLFSVLITFTSGETFYEAAAMLVTFGLDHQDEVFDNPNLGTCMDYTNDPSTNQHPNQHDYDELALIYSHLDSTTTVGTTSAGSKMPPSASRGNLNSRAEWGQKIRESRNGKLEV